MEEDVADGGVVDAAEEEAGVEEAEAVDTNGMLTGYGWINSVLLKAKYFGSGTKDSPKAILPQTDKELGVQRAHREEMLCETRTDCGGYGE